MFSNELNNKYTSMLQVVSQSTEVLEFVKKDFDEFTKVVSEEASSVVSSTANTLKEKLKVRNEMLKSRPSVCSQVIMLSPRVIKLFTLWKVIRTNH